MTDFFKDRDFYKKTLMIALPIMVQNFVTNFVNMLDNIMVGRVGTDPMSGVAIVNQLMFVWNLCLFGGLSGISIFTSQFCGKGDEEGIRYTVRLQLFLTAILLAAGFIIFRTMDTRLITLYLHEDGGIGNAEQTLAYARDYLSVMLIGLVPFGLTQVYSTTLKATGETLSSMTASIMAVAVNLAGNYILIYGKLGAPALGVVGAAAATALSRFVELAYMAFYVHRKREDYAFFRGVLKSPYVPGQLLMNCVCKGTPLLMNETLWSSGQAVLTQIYSLRGLSVVAAFNISQTITNLFNVAFIAMGSAIAIIIGQELGTGDRVHVRRDADRLTVFSILLCMVSGVMLLLVAGIFPRMYNTSEEIRDIAAGLTRIAAVFMPLHAYLNASYFILRSGGKTLITFLFDSVFIWVCSIPVAWSLAHLTAMPILPLYAAVLAADLIKCVIGFVLVRKGVWINDITGYQET